MPEMEKRSFANKSYWLMASTCSYGQQEPVTTRCPLSTSTICSSNDYPSEYFSTKLGLY